MYDNPNSVMIFGINIIVLFYAIVLLLTVVTLFVLVSKAEYQVGLNIFIISAIIIRGYGRLMASMSTSMPMLLLSTYIVFFGRIFIPPLLLISAIRICRMEFPKWFSYVAVGYSVIVYAFSLTIGRNELFYKDVYMIRRDGFTALHKCGYGPAHFVFTSMIFIYGAMFIGVFIYALYKKTTSRYLIYGMFICEMLLLTADISDRLFDLDFDLTSVSYFIISVCALKFIDAYNIRSLYSCVSSILSFDDDTGYIIFDKRNRFIKANKTAERVFPEICGLNIDAEVKPSDTVFYNEIVKKVIDLSKSKLDVLDSFTIKIGQNSYRFKYSKVIAYNYSVTGVLVEIHDISMEVALEEMQTRYNNDLEQEVIKKENDIKKTLEELVLGLAVMIESRDNTTGNHVIRINKIAEIVAKKLLGKSSDFTSEKLKTFFLSVVLHDIGKITVEDEVLRAPYPYNSEQRAIMVKHTIDGAKVVKKIFSKVPEKSLIQTSSDVVRSHHENWDGSGYPDGLKGQEIPVYARLTRILDVFDNNAVIRSASENTYKVDVESAFRVVEEKTGTFFDPYLAKIFLECKDEIKEVYNNVQG